jgi:L-asparagine transporter-like permease
MEVGMVFATLVNGHAKHVMMTTMEDVIPVKTVFIKKPVLLLTSAVLVLQLAKLVTIMTKTIVYLVTMILFMIALRTGVNAKATYTESLKCHYALTSDR